MRFTDKTLRCAECGADFVWTGGEQAFYAEKRLEHEPRRCRACHARGGNRRKPSAEAGRPRIEVEAVCTSCGRATTVPFRPGPGRPVFCRACYQQRRAGGNGPA